MAGTMLIPEPPFPPSEEGFKACLTFVDGQLTYYVNSRYKAGFLWNLWDIATKGAYYEDPSLENRFYGKLTNSKDWIEYSELILIKDEDAPERDRSYPKGYRLLEHRLDFYATRAEITQAFWSIKSLSLSGKQKTDTEAHIFGSLHVLLLDGRKFGKEFTEMNSSVTTP